MKQRVMVRLDDLVGMTEIAERTDKSLQAVSNLATRRPDFPSPVIRLAVGPIFLWSEVGPWMETSLRKQRRPNRKDTP